MSLPTMPTMPTTAGAYTTPATPTTDVPSIGSAASLVDLSISVWTGRKKDKQASAEVTHNKRADAGTANVNKMLLGNCPELDAITKYVGNLRNHTHYWLTMPWSDTGTRLLPTALMFQYHNAMTQAQQEFNTMVDEFLNNYDNEVINAQLRLGDLFNADEYPTREVLARKFAFRINYMPLPDTGDWRVDISNEQSEVLRNSYASFYERQLNGAMADIWSRLHDKLGVLVRQLDYSPSTDKNGNPTSKPNRVYESVFDSVIDLIDLMDACNVTGDENMARAQRELKNILHGVCADQLKGESEFRDETREKLAEVVATLPNLDW